MHRELTHTRRWRTPTVVGVLCALIALLVPLAISAAPASAAGLPDCATVLVGGTSQNCDAYAQQYVDGQKVGGLVLAGDESVSVSSEAVGDLVTITMSNHLTPFADDFVAGDDATSRYWGMYGVSLNINGTLVSESPAQNSDVNFTSNPGAGGGTPTTVSWISTGIANNLTPCNNLAECAFSPGEQFSVTFRVNSTAGTNHVYEAAWEALGGGQPITGNPVGWPSGTLISERIVPIGSAPPTAAFTATQADPANNPGKYQFTDASTDGDGGALTENWDFGDGNIGTGVSVLHTYTEPGTYTATLTVKDTTNGLTATVSKTITVPAPTLQVALDFVDAHGTVLPTVTPVVGDTVYVRLSLSASETGVGSISKIAPPTGSDALTATPSASVAIGTPTPAVPSPLALAGGQSVAYTFPVTVTAVGVVQFTSTFNGVDDAGHAVTGSPAQLSFGVSSIKVTLSANPSSFTQAENASGPQPTTVTVTETITNITAQTLTSVNVLTLVAQRTVSGQLLGVT